jgi:hypothetical protein
MGWVIKITVSIRNGKISYEPPISHNPSTGVHTEKIEIFPYINITESSSNVTLYHFDGVPKKKNNAAPIRARKMMQLRDRIPSFGICNIKFKNRSIKCGFGCRY